MYHERDEIGMLVKEYNEMVDKLEANVKKLAKSERESAWREMARQIAHEDQKPVDPDEIEFAIYAAHVAEGEYGGSASTIQRYLGRVDRTD